MFEVTKVTASMHTRDRVRLDADIYLPKTEEKLPILLMRQPYGRAIASTVVYAHPRWYAARGYIVVIQDVRGRGTSQGEFHLFSSEIEDGLDAITWVSQLPQSNGKVGMYGFSYQGMTQIYAAIHQPEPLKVICPATVAWDLYQDWAYENGAFCWQANLGWAIQLAAETAKLKGDLVAFQKLSRASRHLPLDDYFPYNPTILQELAPDSYYHDWLHRAPEDEYWQKLSPKYLIKDLDLPMLHIAGWFDPYLRGTLNFYRAMLTKCSAKQRLIVGPWAHLPWGRKLGAIDYGREANSAIDLLQLAWFDKYLKNIDSPVINTPPICLFEMGSNEWKYYQKFSTKLKKTYYLTSNSLANLRDDDGQLLEEKLPEITSEDVLVHDPWRPVPALGGHATFPGGSFDRSSLDCRSDIITYTSRPLLEDLHIVGEIELEIYCKADTPSFDLCAILSQVDPQGRVDNFTQGYKRLNRSETPVRLNLQATCIKIPASNCLRLSLSAASFPAYSVNSGTGKIDALVTAIDHQIITLIFTSSNQFCSKISILAIDLS